MAENFIVAKTVEEALATGSSSFAFLSGGTEINRFGSPVDAETLVCIKKLKELEGISVINGTGDYAEEKFVRLGANTTFQQAIDSEIVPEYFRTACRFMSSRTKRNMATLAGNVAAFRDDSYLWAMLLASGAIFEIEDSDNGRCGVTALEYAENFSNYGKDLIIALLIPGDAVVAQKRYANTAASHAVLTIAVSRSCIAVAVKDTGIFIMKKASEISKVEFKDDMFGSAAYKRYLFDVTVPELQKEVVK